MFKRQIVTAFSIGILLIVASIAWVKEGWRLSGYDTEEQMQTAEAAGFSDKETFLAAQAAGISTAGDWEKFSTDMAKAGFDDASEFIAFRAGKFISKDEFTKAKAAGASNRLEWFADAEWQEIATFPKKMLSITNSSGSDCSIVGSETYSAQFAGHMAGTYRDASVRIIQPFHKKRYFLLYNEFVNQRQLLSESLLRMWRSKKDNRYYLAYYAKNDFNLY